MKKSRLTERQFVGVSKRLDAGEKVKNVSRGLGISSATYLRLKVGVPWCGSI